MNNINSGELLTKIDRQFDDNQIDLKEKKVIFNSVLKILYWVEEIDGTMDEEDLKNFDRGQLVNILDVLSQNGPLGKEIVEEIEATFFDMWVDIFMESSNYMENLNDNLTMSEIVYADIDINKKTWDVKLKSHFSDDDLWFWESVLLKLKNMLWEGTEIAGTTFENFWILNEKDKPLKTRVKEMLLEFIHDMPEGKEALWWMANDFLGIFKDIANYTVRKTRELTYSETKRLEEEAEFTEMNNRLENKGYKIIQSYNWTSGFSSVLTYHKENNELYLSIRGTEITDLNDILSDYSILVDDVPPQWQEMNAYFKEVIVPLLESEQFKGKQVTINGHSLGWALSKLLLLSNEKYIKDVYAFNSPWIAEIAEDSIDEFIMDVEDMRRGKDLFMNMSYAPAEHISDFMDEVKSRKVDREKLKNENLIAYNFLTWLDETGRSLNTIPQIELKELRDKYLETKIAPKISDFESKKWADKDGILNTLIVNTGEKLTTPYEIDGWNEEYKGHSISGLNTAFTNDYDRIKDMFSNDVPGDKGKEDEDYSITTFLDGFKRYIKEENLPICYPDDNGIYS